MTFEKLIRLLNILDNDGEILVMDEIYVYPKKVCTISKFSDIFECEKYFKDSSRYGLYIYDPDKPYYEMMEEL